MKPEIKRIFFALDTQAPWPEEFPRGRILGEKHRHMTLAFLGEILYRDIKDKLSQIPKPSFKVGLAGFFDECLFLPPRHPNVVSWHVDWLDDAESLLSFRNDLIAWLKDIGFTPKNEERDFLPHVTVCRKPVEPNEWKKTFIKLPMMASAIYLYESLGNSEYKPLWTHSLISPFQELEHTADIAFCIYGENISQLFNHAQIALAFRFPPMIPFIKKNVSLNNIDDMIIALNEVVAEVDVNAEERTPFKAVSFHGNIKEEANKVLKWEMIVDV